MVTSLLLPTLVYSLFYVYRIEHQCWSTVQESRMLLDTDFIYTSFGHVGNV